MATKIRTAVGRTRADWLSGGGLCGQGSPFSRNYCFPPDCRNNDKGETRRRGDEAIRVAEEHEWRPGTIWTGVKARV